MFFLIFENLVCHNLTGAEISIGDFLASSKNDLSLKNQEEKISFLHTTSPDTPFLDRVEFRTRTDEGFDQSNQRYSLRFYPNGLGETKAGEKVHNTTVESNKVHYDLLLHQALKERYTLIINVLNTLDLLELKKKLMVVYEDKAIVLNSQMNTPDFKITELIDAKDDVVKLQIEIIELENKLNTIEETMRLCISTEGSISLSRENLADTDSVRRSFLQISSLPDAENVYLRDSNYSKEIARGMYELEKAEGKRYINFLEAGYDNEEGGRPSDSISFGLGINLPFVRSNRIDVNRRKLQFLSAKGEHEDLKRSLEEKLRSISGELNKMFRQYDVLMEEKTTGGTESTLKKYMETEGINPITLLNMQESIIKKDLLIMQKQYEIYTKYIEYLDISGQLTKTPVRNYLSQDFEQIEL
ncbi:MAG: TolC family protein [Planctomycetes bacterium]|nr:TolC family protein [Planctomycetota bacterium]